MEIDIASIGGKLSAFIMNEFAGAGFTGAIIVVLASFYTDVFVPFSNWLQRTAYPFAGVLIGAWTPHMMSESVITCFVLGAVWLHIPNACKQLFDAAVKAKAQSIQEPSEKES